MFICALQLSMAKYCTVKIKKSIFKFCTVWCWYLISYPYKESCLSLKMPHSGSSLISVIAFWAAMSFQIFQNVKQINLNSNWLSFNDFGIGRNVEKKVLYSYYSWVINLSLGPYWTSLWLAGLFYFTLQPDPAPAPIWVSESAIRDLRARQSTLFRDAAPAWAADINYQQLNIYKWHASTLGHCLPRVCHYTVSELFNKYASITIDNVIKLFSSL